MKTVKGIVYEGKTPDMDWDIEKDIENQIASTKAEFIEEYGEKIKEEIKDEYGEELKKEAYEELKERIYKENINKIKEEIYNENIDKIKEEYFNKLSSETREQNTIILIKNMLKEKYPLKSIAKITNKSLEEIKKISES